MPDDYVEEVVVGAEDMPNLTEVAEDDDLVEEEIDTDTDTDVVIPPTKKPVADVDGEEEETPATPEEEEMEEIEQLLDPYGEREEALY